MNPQPPTTLAEIVATGVAWDIETERNTYVLTYQCASTQREQRKIYCRDALNKIDPRIVPTLHVLSESWSGKSIHNGLARTALLWSAPKQTLMYKENIFQWETWESLNIEQTSESYTLSLRTYDLLDHPTPYLTVAHPMPGHIKIRINSIEFEKQYPGVLAAIETAYLGELSAYEAAQYCLATLNFPNTLYPERSQRTPLPELPHDFLI